jgi:hypothetical protein
MWKNTKKGRGNAWNNFEPIWFDSKKPELYGRGIGEKSFGSSFEAHESLPKDTKLQPCSEAE